MIYILVVISVVAASVIVVPVMTVLLLLPPLLPPMLPPYLFAAVSTASLCLRCIEIGSLVLPFLFDLPRKEKKVQHPKFIGELEKPKSFSDTVRCKQVGRGCL